MISLIDNEIVITRADKGNATVTMLRSEYMDKMKLFLSDTNTYRTVDRDPTQKIINVLKDVLRVWRDETYIINNTYRRLYKSDGVLPRAYALPKIHKDSCPLRIIISSLNRPLYDFAFYLHNVISKSLPRCNTSIKDSFSLTKELNNIHVPDGYKLISLDVVTLFTNVPTDLAIMGINKRWRFLKLHTKITKEFIRAMATSNFFFVLDSTYFAFDHTIYRQIFGSLMRSPLSPIIADMVLQDLKNSALSRLSFVPPFYYRYYRFLLR